MFLIAAFATANAGCGDCEAKCDKECGSEKKECCSEGDSCCSEKEEHTHE